jgi:hypothetical protein
MEEEEFHWVFGVMQGWFLAKVGVKNQSWIPIQYNIRN